IPAVTPAFSIPAQQSDVVAGRAWDNIVRLRIDQVLFTGFRLTSQYAVANLDRQIGLSRLSRAHQDIAEQVKLAYFRVLKAEEERALALDLDQAMRLAQSQRPELKELALNVDRAREGVVQAKSSNYPRVGLFGQVEKQPSEPIHPVSEIFTAGVEATWILWEWRRSSHERAQAEFRRLQALTDLEDRRSAIVQEVRAVYPAVRHTE